MSANSRGLTDAVNFRHLMQSLICSYAGASVGLQITKIQEYRIC